MNKSIVLGIIAIALILFASQFVSADASFNWHKVSPVTFKTIKDHQTQSNANPSTYDSRTSAEKYYYSYSKSTDSSDWRNKQVFNSVDYNKQNLYKNNKESYTDNYYYSPRLNSNTQSYNWRF